MSIDLCCSVIQHRVKPRLHVRALISNKGIVPGRQASDHIWTNDIISAQCLLPPRIRSSVATLVFILLVTVKMHISSSSDGIRM